MIKDTHSNKFQFQEMFFYHQKVKLIKMIMKKKKRLIAVVNIISSHDRQAAPLHGYRQAANSLFRNGDPFLLQGSAQLSQAGWGLLPGPDPPLQLIPQVFYGVQVWGFGGPRQHSNSDVGQVISDDPCGVRNSAVVQKC